MEFNYKGTDLRERMNRVLSTFQRGLEYPSFGPNDCLGTRPSWHLPLGASPILNRK
jgi:hypothetical protein